MNKPPTSEFTAILRQLGPTQVRDEQAVDRLLPLIYRELRSVADGLLRGERPDHTLQPTALVHEAYLRLVGVQDLRLADRAHFLALAARAMRRILVDHARQRGAAKRAHGRQRVTLQDADAPSVDGGLEVLELDDALDKLQRIDQRAGQVAEMRLFGGLTVKEIAAALDISPRSVDGDWAMARMWLSREITGPERT